MVQDRARLKRYSDKVKERLLTNFAREQDHKARHYESMLRNESFNIFYDAGTLIAIGSARRSPYAQGDCWLAAQNLMLAAHAAGFRSAFGNSTLDPMSSR